MSPSQPLSLTFHGAQTPDGGPVSIAGGRIADAPQRKIDASGYLVLPGIIDLHGDGFERHLAPRRGAMMDLALGLRSAEAELAANGITTGVLAQFMSWEGGMRGPDFAARLVEALADYRAEIDLRLQIRLEISLRDVFDDLRALTERHPVDLVVLNDHLPHKHLARGARPPGLTGEALRAGRSPEAHGALLARLHQDLPQAKAALAPLTEALKARGIRIGSHDDHTPEDRAAFRALGADIAEFPETRAAAEAAKAAGEPVIMGAPNVVRGGSHSGKVAAADLIQAGLVDALVSDYHYPAPHRAALCLWDAGLPLAQAWALISEGPARVMGWADRGHLRPDARADLVVIHAETHRIEATLAAGRIVHLCGGFANRLLSACV